VLEASSYVALKIGQQEMTPLTMASMRNLWTFLVLAPVVLATGTHLELRCARPRVLGGLLAMGLLGFSVASLLIFGAVSELSATTAGLLQALRPLLALLLGLALLRDRPSGLQVLGVLIILLGGYLFFPATPAASELRAMLLLVGGYALMVVCQVIGRGLGLQGVSTLSIVAVPFAIGGVVLTAVLLVDEGLPSASWRAVAVIAYLAIVASAGGFALIYHALRRLTNVELSSMTNLVPLATAVLAAGVLGEALTLQMMVGLVIATLGVFIVQSRPGVPAA
jgi:drug/metabolite transporter (DMT)-like permease